MKLMVMTDIYIVLKIDEIQEILTAERDKRNELSTKYNRWFNIIGVIDNCLGVTAIGLDITGVSLLSTIVAAPAIIGIEAVSIVMGLLWVVGNQAIKKLSLKKETHQKIAILAVSTLTLSVVTFQKRYQMIPFQMNNIHLFYQSLKRSHERKKNLEKNLRWALKKLVI